MIFEGDKKEAWPLATRFCRAHMLGDRGNAPKINDKSGFLRHLAAENGSKTTDKRQTFEKTRTPKPAAILRTFRYKLSVNNETPYCFRDPAVD